jgi:hypothetical protein
LMWVVESDLKARKDLASNGAVIISCRGGSAVSLGEAGAWFHEFDTTYCQSLHTAEFFLEFAANPKAKGINAWCCSCEKLIFLYEWPVET